MIPRGKLYISYGELFVGLYYCLKPGRKIALQPKDNKLVCLSVRTGFDVVLRALSLPAGSEILVTDVNIPDMFRIIKTHNLVAVPLAVNKHTLSISASQFESAITPKTKAILITHLFGGIMETDEIFKIAKKHKLLVFEDCAQAFSGNIYDGNPESDIVMFSFGFIKTNTAVSGAVIKINNFDLYNKAVSLNEQYTRQGTLRYFKKMLKVSFVKFINSKAVYTLFYKLMIAFGKDFEQVLNSFTKGFSGSEVFKQIRYRPCTANELLVKRKLANFNQERITERVNLANDLLSDIPSACKIGSLNKQHTYWVVPIEAPDPNGLIDFLRSNGFDASHKASSLIHLNPLTPCDINGDELNLEKLVYLPAYPAMSKIDRKRLTGFIRDHFEK